MTPPPVPSVSDALTASDWFAFLGVIVAAVLGVGVAVWGQWRARKAAERDSLDSALAAVIRALGERALELEAWAEPGQVPVVGSMDMTYMYGHRRDEAGGPIDARLHTAVEAAWLLAKTSEDARCLAALADATFHLKAARVSWQITRAGQVAASVREWRTGAQGAAGFVAQMAAHREAALAAAPPPNETPM